MPFIKINYFFKFKLQPSKTTTTIFEASQIESTEKEHPSQKVLSTSPLSSDEGLVMAEEEEFDMDLDADMYKKYLFKAFLY
jgi:hypothetical protein